MLNDFSASFWGFILTANRCWNALNNLAAFPQLSQQIAAHFFMSSSFLCDACTRKTRNLDSHSIADNMFGSRWSVFVSIWLIRCDMITIFSPFFSSFFFAYLCSIVLLILLRCDNFSFSWRAIIVTQVCQRFVENAVNVFAFSCRCMCRLSVSNVNGTNVGYFGRNEMHEHGIRVRRMKAFRNIPNATIDWIVRGVRSRPCVLARLVKWQMTNKASH